MSELPKKLTTTRVLRMIDNIHFINPDCEISVPADMMCHASIICSADRAKHEIRDLTDLYSIRPEAGETTWDVWYRKYDKGMLVKISFTAHNKQIDNFRPGLIGPLD
jgi:hypothetical protein